MVVGVQNISKLNVYVVKVLNRYGIQNENTIKYPSENTQL